MSANEMPYRDHRSPEARLSYGLPTHALQLLVNLERVVSEFVVIPLGEDVRIINELAEYVDRLIAVRLPFHFVREMRGRNGLFIDEWCVHRDGALMKRALEIPGVRPATLDDIDVSKLIELSLEYRSEPSCFIDDPPTTREHPAAHAAAYGIRAVREALRSPEGNALADAIGLAGLIYASVCTQWATDESVSSSASRAAQARHAGDPRSAAMKAVKAHWTEMLIGKAKHRSDAQFARDMMKDYGEILSEGGIKNAISRWRKGEE